MMARMTGGGTKLAKSLAGVEREGKRQVSGNVEVEVGTTWREATADRTPTAIVEGFALDAAIMWNGTS